MVFVKFAKTLTQFALSWPPEWPIQSTLHHRRSPLPTRQSMQLRDLMNNDKDCRVGQLASLTGTVSSPWVFSYFNAHGVRLHCHHLFNLLDLAFQISFPQTRNGEIQNKSWTLSNQSGVPRGLYKEENQDNKQGKVLTRALRLDVDSAASASAFLSPFTSTYSRGKNPYFFTFYLANNFDSSDSNSGSSGLLATSPMDL